MATDFVASVPRSWDDNVDASRSGISWAAVVAGAFVTAALSLSLMALGAGMGLSSVSPWPSAGASASRIAPVAILWIILVQAASCALGGYLAGRLRTRWATVHTHEVYFRDTAHGFLVWAVGFVISVFFLSSVGANLAKEAASAQAPGAHDYYVDSLFRSQNPSIDGSDTALRGEAAAILAAALSRPDVAPADKTYLASLVAAKTGISQAEAETRVTETLTAARQALDTARKAVAHSLYWLFAALLIGAFCASVAATMGGKQRDRVVMIPATPVRRA